MGITWQILVGRNSPIPLPPKRSKIANGRVNKRPMEVGFSKQASKLVLSLEVSLSRSHSPTRGRGLEDTTPASPRLPTPLGEGRCERRGRRPRQVLPNRTCRRPNLGTVGRGRPGPLPGRRRSRHLHGERNLLLRAHHDPQRGVEKRGGEERRGPPGRAAQRARPGHAGLPPTRRRQRQERPRGAAQSGRWASALGCLLRAAPPASRAPGSLGEQKKDRWGGGGGGVVMWLFYCCPFCKPFRAQFPCKHKLIS